MGKTIYRSKIDWWVWLVTAGFLLIIWLSAIGMSWWYVVFVSGLMTLLYAWLMFGCWYEIDGNELVIYQFFSPTRLPISNIKDVKKTTGYLATAGMSHLRVSISFNDRPYGKATLHWKSRPIIATNSSHNLLKSTPILKKSNVEQ